MRVPYVQAQERACWRIPARGIVLLVARCGKFDAIADERAHAISSHGCLGPVRVSLSMAQGSYGLSAIMWTSDRMGSHSCQDPREISRSEPIFNLSA